MKRWQDMLSVGIKRTQTFNAIFQILGSFQDSRIFGCSGAEAPLRDAFRRAMPQITTSRRTPRNEIQLRNELGLGCSLPRYFPRRPSTRPPSSTPVSGFVGAAACPALGTCGGLGLAERPRAIEKAKEPTTEG